MSEPSSTLACATCSAEFELTESHRNWFIARNLQVPTRCEPCRKANRERRAQESNQQQRRRAHRSTLGDVVASVLTAPRPQVNPVMPEVLTKVLGQ